MAEAGISSDWTERYRPVSESLLEGNESGRARIKEWLKAWDSGLPKKRGMLLVGPPGVGKTTIARAIAIDRGWDVIELNASDERNAPAIRRAATHGSTHTSLFHTDSPKKKQRKLILLDEVDHLSGGFGEMGEKRIRDAVLGDGDGERLIVKGDRGGKAELLRLLSETRQPVILACNDEMGLWGKGRSWRQGRDRLLRLADKVQFARAGEDARRKISKRVLDREEITIDPSALDLFVRQNPGDLRALVKDLQIMASGESGHIDLATVKNMVELGRRDSVVDLFPGLDLLYRLDDAKAASELVRILDKDPDEMAAWISWNNSSVHADPAAIRRSAAAMTKADQALPVRFTNRAYRSWYWGSNITSLAASVTGTAPQGRLQLQYPAFLRRGHEAWRRAAVIERLAQTCGASIKSAKRELYPPLAALHVHDNAGNDIEDFRISMALGLDGEEHAALCGLAPRRKETLRLIDEYDEKMASGSAQITPPEPLIEELPEDSSDIPDSQTTLF